MQEGCVFCQIIKKEEAFIVHETSTALAFLDINPVSKGHTLVIPKDHYQDISDIDEDALRDIMSAAKEAAGVLQRKLGADGVNILHASGKAAQQSVFHFHLHVVPRFKGDGLDIWPEDRYTGSLEDVYKAIK